MYGNSDRGRLYGSSADSGNLYRNADNTGMYGGFTDS
jgi:hypothetical protein